MKYLFLVFKLRETKITATAIKRVLPPFNTKLCLRFELKNYKTLLSPHGGPQKYANKNLAR